MNHIIDSLGASIFDHFELNVLYLNDIIDSLDAIGRISTVETDFAGLKEDGAF